MDISAELYDHLKSEGFDVYSPSQKTGECKKRYVVVRDSGISSVAGISSNMALFDVMCYVPKDHFFKLGGYVKLVKESIDKMYPLLRPSGFQTPSFYDDTVKAHMVSVQYQNYQKKVR